MINPFTDPPKLLLQALEDLGAIAAVARRLPELEDRLAPLEVRAEEVLDQALGDLAELRAGLGRLEGMVIVLQEEMSPIAELPKMREAVEPLDGRMQVMSDKLDGLREEMSPIQELPAVRAAIEPLGDELGAKMDTLRDHVDDIEPQFDRVVNSIEELVPKIEEVREGVAPIADVIDNLPKFMRN